MCYLNKFRFLKPKFAAFFALTLLVGLAFNAYFGRYTISYSVTEVFTKSEKSNLKGKRVLDTCFKTSATGTVTNFTDLGIEVTYDQPILGKYKQLNSDKQTFKKCTVLID